MSEINKARKEDLYQVAFEMDLQVQPDMKIAKLRKLIKTSALYEDDFEFVDSLFKNQIAAREEKRRQDEELERRKLEMAHELEVLKLRSQNQENSGGVVGRAATSISVPAVVDIQKLLPTFNPETDDVSLFLVLLERQLKLSKVPEMLWVSHLLSVLPSSILTLIAREPEEKASDFTYVRDLLLKRFKLSAEKIRQLLFSHRKSREATWRDFYFELKAYFDNWIKELQVKTFEDLQDLFITDLMKRRVSPECREHLLDDWENLKSPHVLADKLDSFDNLRSVITKKEVSLGNARKGNFQHENTKRWNKPISVNTKAEQTGKTPFPSTASSSHTKENKLYCYGCGKPGFIKSKCPSCSMEKNQTVEARTLRFYHCRVKHSEDLNAMNIPVTICGTEAWVCADTGATRCIAGERLHKLFVDSNVKLKSTVRDVTLADGVTRSTEILTTTVPVKIKDRTFETEFIVFPHAKGNRTLLGLDFLQSSGIVLDVARKSWYFGDLTRKRYKVPVSDSLTGSQIPVSNVVVNTLDLRENEGKSLSPEEREKLNRLLKSYGECFRPGGEPTPFAEHRINTGNHAPVFCPPYRRTPAKIYIRRLSYDVRERDLEKFFKGYGRIREILIKNGFGFVEFDDYRDADDAVYELNGKELFGERVTIEHARGSPRGNDIYRDRNRGYRAPMHSRRRQGGGRDKYGPPTRTEYRLIVENLCSRVSWQDLKDYMRQAGEVTYADAHKQRRNEGVVEFASFSDMKNALDKLDDTDLSGRRIKLIEDSAYFDRNRRKQYFAPGDKVWVVMHPTSKADKKKTAKFMPKRDGPYIIVTQKSPVSYVISNVDRPLDPIGTYHVSSLETFRETETVPVAPLRKRGRPRKQGAVPGSGRAR